MNNKCASALSICDAVCGSILVVYASRRRVQPAFPRRKASHATLICVAFILGITPPFHAQVEGIVANDSHLIDAPIPAEADSSHIRSSCCGVIQPHLLGLAPARLVSRHVIDRTFILLSGLFVGTVVADAESTKFALDHGGRELNPIFGAHPSRARMYGTTMPIAAWVIYWAYGAKKHAPRYKAWMFPPLFGAVVHGGAAASNAIGTEIYIHDRR
jgi:hypothetical protein